MPRFLARVVLFLMRLRFVPPEHPLPDKMVLISAPHTSNWDLPLALSIASMAGVEMRWLGKRELFRGPMGPVMRAIGGIPVDRSSPGGVVEAMAHEFASRDRLGLVVAVEGTRKPGSTWKSGFYRIARAAQVPIGFGYVDTRDRVCGIARTVELSGDVVADMDVVRDFYAGKRGMRPGNETVPRLAEEDRLEEGPDAA